MAKKTPSTSISAKTTKTAPQAKASRKTTHDVIALPKEIVESKPAPQSQPPEQSNGTIRLLPRGMPKASVSAVKKSKKNAKKTNASHTSSSNTANPNQFRGCGVGKLQQQRRSVSRWLENSRQKGLLTPEREAELNAKLVQIDAEIAASSQKNEKIIKLNTSGRKKSREYDLSRLRRVIKNARMSLMLMVGGGAQPEAKPGQSGSFVGEEEAKLRCDLADALEKKLYVTYYPVTEAYIGWNHQNLTPHEVQKRENIFKKILASKNYTRPTYRMVSGWENANNDQTNDDIMDSDDEETENDDMEEDSEEDEDSSSNPFATFGSLDNQTAQDGGVWGSSMFENENDEDDEDGESPSLMSKTSKTSQARIASKINQLQDSRSRPNVGKFDKKPFVQGSYYKGAKAHNATKKPNTFTKSPHKNKTPGSNPKPWNAANSDKKKK